MADLGQTGGFSINGKWATRIAYDVDLDSGQITQVNLRFIIGRSLVAQTQLTRVQAIEVLGKGNVAAIEEGAAERKEGTQERINGELSGRTLHYRRATLPTEGVRSQDNTIEREGLSGGKQKAESTGERGEGADASHHRLWHPASDGLGPTDMPMSPGTSAEARRLAQRHAIPEEIARRFVRVGDRFYFPDRSLAFVDRGNALKAESENPEVVRILVGIAQARAWEAIRVNGTEDFRRLVWREATRQGLAIRGYTSTEVERAEAEREASKPSSPARDVAPVKELHRENRERGQVTAQDLREGEHGRRQDAPRSGGNRPTFQSTTPGSELIMGRLIEHGPAHYQFDDKKAQSYFVRLETPLGPTVRWGVDLDRAFAASRTRPQLGDEIGVEFHGARAVTVKAPVLDQDGHVIRQHEMTAHRNSWIVEKREYFQQRRLRALAIKDEGRSKEEIAREYPELAGALATVRLAELFASKNLSTAPDQTRFVTLVRDAMARAIEHEAPLPVPMLREPRGHMHDRDGQRAKSPADADSGREPPALERA